MKEIKIFVTHTGERGIAKSDNFSFETPCSISFKKVRESIANPILIVSKIRANFLMDGIHSIDLIVLYVEHIESFISSDSISFLNIITNMVETKKKMPIEYIKPCSVKIPYSCFSRPNSGLINSLLNFFDSKLIKMKYPFKMKLKFCFSLSKQLKKI